MKKTQPLIYLESDIILFEWREKYFIILKKISRPN